MAVEKGKVLTKLNEILKDKSASKNFKENLATKWAAKIETDEDIDGFISDREDIILEAASEADRRATAAADTARKDIKDKVNGEEKKTETPMDDPNQPAFVKQLMDKFNSLESQLTTFKAEKQAQTIAERFNADERVKNIPEAIRSRFIPSSEDDIEKNIVELSTVFAPLAEQTKLAGFGNDKPTTVAGVQPTGKVKEASKEEIAAVAAIL